MRRRRPGHAEGASRSAPGKSPPALSDLGRPCAPREFGRTSPPSYPSTLPELPIRRRHAAFGKPGGGRA
eukprot:scaffold259_cov252-Pinguiococcus_pyrenoidosus.AAC.9